MAWKPQIVTSSGPDVTIPYEADFLASEFFTVKRVGITIAASTITADAQGNKVLPKGCTMGRLTDGRYTFYNNAASDGTQTAIGFLMESVNARWGDCTAGLMISGSVIGDRCSGLNAAAQVELAGAFTFQ